MFSALAVVIVALGVAGCQSAAKPDSVEGSTKVLTTVGAGTPVSAVTKAVAIRINAGASVVAKDSDGNEWLADQGFEGGDVVERPDIQIANTQTPIIYQSEHYGMDSFSWKLPNGKYQVKLHFAETYEGIDGPGERMFSFSVQGHEFKDFDVWKLAGGGQRALVESVDVEVADGMLAIKFTSNIENPQINAIEIIPLM